MNMLVKGVRPGCKNMHWYALTGGARLWIISAWFIIVYWSHSNVGRRHGWEVGQDVGQAVRMGGCERLRYEVSCFKLRHDSYSVYFWIILKSFGLWPHHCSLTLSYFILLIYYGGFCKSGPKVFPNFWLSGFLAWAYLSHTGRKRARQITELLPLL